MEQDNFLRTFSVGKEKYVATARPSQYQPNNGEPQYFIQIWKMNQSNSGALYQPALKGWKLPSVQGYAIRTMNLNAEYSRFIEDFKEHEKKKLNLPTPKSAKY